MVAFCLVLWLGPPAYPDEDPLIKQTPEELIEAANFILRLRPNYSNAYWVVRGDDNDPIGYAPYDSARQRWTIFSLKGTYYGFIQAVIGDRKMRYFTHLLWYGKDNEYKGFFVARLGGRPVTPDLPFGELGGEYIPYLIGNLPMEQSEYKLELDPLRRFPAGVAVEPVRPPSKEWP